MQDAAKIETPETKSERRRIARAIAKVIWDEQWKSANPEGSREARKAEWKEAQSEQVTLTRRALRRLEKQGIQISLREAAGALDEG